MFDVCTTCDTAHILPHTRQHVDACVTKHEYRVDVCHVTREAHIEHI